MCSLAIAQQRLNNQGLSLPVIKKPSEVVQWLGAVQAQDYYGAKWALAQRMQHASDTNIEEAFARGEILRTHVMRPTWHFVAPGDIRWMLKLTSPRLRAASRYYNRRLELDDAVFKLTNRVFAKALQGGKQLTRDALKQAFQKQGIATANSLRFVYILYRAELDGIICSGARVGKQFTYALLEDRVPQTTSLSREEAIAELTRRYFTSHGPATIQDFVWWSGLTTADAKAGVSMLEGDVLQEVVNDRTYWLLPSAANRKPVSRVACLLPTFDEYLISYKDRTAALPLAFQKQTRISSLGLEAPLVIDGYVVGTWKRRLTKESAFITLRPFAPLTRADKQLVTKAVHRYGAFLDMKAVLA